MVSLFFFIPFFALIVFFISGIWKAFEKAGHPGWTCLIPIYSFFIMLQIAKKPAHWFFFMLIPLVNIYFIVKILHAISLNFGKNSGFTLAFVFFTPICWAILGHGNARYLDSEGNPESWDEDILDSDLV